MWMYLLLFCFLQRALSIRLTSIRIPDRVSAGSHVPLSCDYDLEGEKLYNVKWYFDNVEFFRYVPSEKETKFFFPVKNIQVDLERSGNETVFIQDVKTNTSGTYRCEISADAPSFHTLEASKMMAVEEVQELPDADSSKAIAKSSPCYILTLLAIFILIYQSNKTPN